jgi:catechol 2,3-dioxygenase-like lactoylglutathione lyase family enzyme
MKIHLGRLIDHVHLRVADLDASKRFYRAILRSLERGITMEGPGFFAADELFVTGREGDQSSRIHLAFQAADRAAVDHCYREAIAAGARDNGAPGERSYHPGYYSAYFLDPDGNNLEVVHHGPAERSAPSVVVTAKP